MISKKQNNNERNIINEMDNGAMSLKDKNDCGPHITGPTYRELEAQRDRLAELLRASVAVFERAAAELCRDLDHDVRVMVAVEMHRRAVASELAAIEKEKQP